MSKMLEKYGLVIHKDFPRQLIHSKDELDILSDFLSMWKDPDDIKKYVLPYIDKVLNGEIEEGEVGAEVVGVADIGSEKTFIGNSQIGYEQMFLPTEDFKQLWLEWIDILESYKRRRRIKEIIKKILRYP